MPRSPRVIVPGLPVHVTQRGHNRAPTFRDAHDHATYLEILSEAADHFSCAIHGYALMTNHVHLLFTPSTLSGPAQLLQRVGSRYVRCSNLRYRRSGTLWDGRYHSTLVDTDRYLLVCSRYIDLNPVRARIVAEPDDFEWSSYRSLAVGHADALIVPHAAYAALGATPASRQAAYREFCTIRSTVAEVDEIREATRRRAVAGTDVFHQRVADLIARPTRRLAHGGSRRTSSPL